MPEVSIVAAFVAGVLSVASPCILPLLPIYVAHVSGVALQGDAPLVRRRVMGNAAAFVLGFSSIFVALGLALGAAGQLGQSLDLVAGNRVWLVRFGGVVMLGLGLIQLGLIRVPWLDRAGSGRGITAKGTWTSSFVMGVSFAAGWSPCVGPILGGILTLAAGQGSIRQATILLVTYATGMAIPFLLTAFSFSQHNQWLRRLNARAGLISAVSGSALVGVGIIMVLGIYQRLFVEIIRLAPWAPWEPTL